MAKFNLVEGNEILYKTMKNCARIGARALLLDGRDESSPMKVNLFDIAVRDSEANRQYYIEVSYLLAEKLYTWDVKEVVQGKTSIIPKSRIGLSFPEAFILNFLRIHNAKTGTLKTALAQEKKENGFEMQDPSFYLDILQGKDYVVHHAGNSDGKLYKYSLDESQIKEVKEAFAALFRNVPSKQSLRFDDSIAFRTQWEEDRRGSNRQTEESDESNQMSAANIRF